MFTTALLNINFNHQHIPGIVAVLILLIFSGMISASEVAFFSLPPSKLEKLRKRKDITAKRITALLSKPERFLATILITNNFVNIGIIVISSWLASGIFDFNGSPVLEFIIQTLIITFLILFFGEILPKAYAANRNIQVATFLCMPVFFLSKLLYPFTFLFTKSSKVINRKIQTQQGDAINNLSHAIDLASEKLDEDEKLLRGIVSFGNIDAKEIMISRMDIVTVGLNFSFSKVLGVINETGFSRIPVISQNFDDIKGIIYIKDLLPHLHKTEFRWQSLIRPAYFVPETKKINDLLEEFQRKKIHLAIVIDEYGGSSGIVTLEDILEEIVGNIDDEFDNGQPSGYARLSENEYVFDGKILLVDFYKILDLPEDVFEKVKGDADTLAGLILEINGNIPKKNDVVKTGGFTFKILSADLRRIRQISVNFKKEK